jgi:PST family polysaccharide transporter
MANWTQFFETEHLKADLKGRSVRGGAATLGGQGVYFVVQTASTMILARLLTPADFGLIAMVTAVTGFASLFKDLGLSMATVQKAEITHEQVSVLFWVNVAVSLMIALITAASAPVIAWFYGEPRLTAVAMALSLAFILGGLTVQHQALLRRQMRFTVLAVIPILSTAVAALAAIVSATLGLGYWALVVMELVLAFTNAAAVWIASPWRPGLPSRHAGVRGMVAFGANLTGFNILNYFTRNADSVVVGYALGSGPLGIYSKAYGLLTLPIRQINSPLTGVMLPALSRLQSDPEKYRNYYLRALAGIAMITMPIVSLLFVIADEVVLIVLGDQWISAVSVFRLLAPAAFLGSVNFAPGWLCISLGRPGIQLRWSMLSAPVTVIAFLVGVNWGVGGVATAFSATWCVLFVLLLAWASRGSPVRFRDILCSLVVPLIASVVAAAMTGAVLMWFGLEGLVAIRFVAALLIFGVSYLCCVMATSAGRELMRFLKDLPSLMRTKQIVTTGRQ